MLKKIFPIMKDVWMRYDIPARNRHLTLFALTLFTMTMAGFDLSVHRLFSAKLLDGLIYSSSAMSVLLVHSFAHIYQARSYGLSVSLPYLIPMPLMSPFGTLGAFVRLHAVPVDKKSLFDIAFWAPALSFILSTLLTVVGVKLTELSPTTSGFENPLVVEWIAQLFWEIPQGYDLALHPLLLAGWGGLFFTAINLFPLGELDGGQIAYAIFGKRQREIAYIFMGFLIFLAFQYPLWFAFVLIFVYLGVEHPDIHRFQQSIFGDTSFSTSGERSLDKHRQILAVIAILIFIVTITIKPFEAPKSHVRSINPFEFRAPPTPEERGPVPLPKKPPAPSEDTGEDLSI